MGSERPENCPVDSFQWRTGGSPGKGVATIEIAEQQLPCYSRQSAKGTFVTAIAEL